MWEEMTESRGEGHMGEEDRKEERPLYMCVSKVAAIATGGSLLLRPLENVQNAFWNIPSTRGEAGPSLLILYWLKVAPGVLPPHTSRWR